MMKKMYGLSLVELLVSIAVGLILMTGVVQVFIGAKSSYSSQQALGRVQENARFLMEMLGKDVRNAGYGGCGNLAKKIAAGEPSFFNMLNDNTSPLLNFSNPISAYNNATGNIVLAPTQTISPLAGTDVLLIKTATEIAGSNLLQSGVNPTTLELKVTNVAANDCTYNSAQSDRVSGFCKGDILMISDCSQSVIFQATNINSTSGIMGHDTSTTFKPGNRLSSWPNTAQFSENSEIYQVNSLAYFIQNDPQGRPALYSYSASTTPAENLLINDVENMQIQYGVDTSTNSTTANDGVPEVYQTANNVTDPSKIVSINFSFLLASPEPALTQAQTLMFNGISTTYSDLRLRQVVNFSIGVRNRLSGKL